VLLLPRPGHFTHQGTIAASLVWGEPEIGWIFILLE
jgi:hypothetical protein